MKINFINNSFKLISFGKNRQVVEDYSDNKPEAFYIIDTRGNYIKFHSFDEAQNYITEQERVQRKQNPHGKQIFFIKDSSELENQNRTVNPQKIKLFLSLFGEMKKSHIGGYKPIEIYAIKTAEDYRKYGSLRELADDLNLKEQVVSSAFRNGYKVHGYIMKRFNEVEDREGFIDKQKIMLAIKEAPKKGNKEVPVYIIDEHGEAKKFNSIKDLAIALNCDGARISTNLRYGHKVRGKIVKYAKDLENDKQELDKTKLQELIEFYKNKALLPRKKSSVKKIERPKKKEKPQTSIYAINAKTGKVIKFENPAKLAEVFGINPAAITYFLQNPKLSLRNFKIVSPSKIENIDGEIDEEKIKKILA